MKLMEFNQWIQIFSLIGVWIAALGTCTASAIAIYLAFRTEKVKLRLTVGFRMNENSQRLLFVQVTNLSLNPVTISFVNWEIGRYRNVLIQTDKFMIAQLCNKKLSYGESIQYYTKPDIYESWKSYFIQFIGDHPLSSLRFALGTSIGQNKKQKLEKSFIRQLKNMKNEPTEFGSEFGADE